MKIIFSTFILLLLQWNLSLASEKTSNQFFSQNNYGLSFKANSSLKSTNISVDSIEPIKHPKLTAAILTLTLGMLGAHRLYLGCKPWVPVFYLLTVGGVFFVIPLIDFIAILTAKDISKYYNNSAVLMWMKP